MDRHFLLQQCEFCPQVDDSTYHGSPCSQVTKWSKILRASSNWLDVALKHRQVPRGMSHGGPVSMDLRTQLCHPKLTYASGDTAGHNPSASRLPQTCSHMEKGLPYPSSCSTLSPNMATSQILYCQMHCEHLPIDRHFLWTYPPELCYGWSPAFQRIADWNACSGLFAAVVTFATSRNLS